MHLELMEQGYDTAIYVVLTVNFTHTYTHTHTHTHTEKNVYKIGGGLNRR